MNKCNTDRIRALYRYIFMIGMLVVLFTKVSVANAAENNQTDSTTIRVGWYYLEDYQEMNDDGTPYGYYYDYLQTVSYYTGWQYEYVQGSWSKCLRMLEQGDIDMMCDVHKTSEREKHMLFSSSQCGSETCCLYVPLDDTKYSYGDFDAFNHMKIAVAADSFEQKSLKQYALDNGFKYTELLCYSFEEADEAVKSGKADALVSASTDSHNGYTVVGQFATTPVYFAVRNGGDDIRSELNHAMICIDTYYSNFDTMLYSNNIVSKTRQSVTLTKAEKKYVKTVGTITMACGKSWYPFEYYDEKKGEYTGISVEIMRKAAKLTGLDVEFVEDTGFSMSEFRENGQINRLTSMSYDYELAAASKVHQTQPFIETNVLQITLHSNSVKSVALLKSGYIYQKVVENYPNLKVVYCDSTRACIDAVAQDKADCTFLNEYESAYYLEMSKYHQLDTNRISAFSQNICYGISETSDSMLLEILSKAILAIDNDTRDQIIADATPVPDELGIIVWMYNYPGMAISVGIFGIVAVFFVVFLLYRNRMEHRRRIVMERANKAKTDFMSRMSHDIRTPMNVIIGMTRLAKENDNSKDTTQCLSKIEVASEFLLGLVNDVLDMVKVESGKVEINLAPYSGRDFKNYIVSLVKPLCEEKNIIFIDESDDFEEYTLLMDKLRINQIFFNLFSNAVKFTDEGGTVSFKINSKILNDNIVDLTAEVSDTGIGMSQEFQEHMFEAFTQEVHEIHPVSQGTGLGLSIVKKMCDIMNIDIEVQSEFGKGTVFKLHGTFMRVKEDKDNENSMEMSHELTGIEDDYTVLKGAAILVSEDHPMNQEIIRRVLEKKGVIVTMAGNGKMCLDIFESSTPGEYKAIIMDIRMPVMNGLDATKCIRKLARADAENIPIIAMTANAFDDDRIASRDAGMDAHLSKPIEPQVVYDTLKRLIK